MIPLPSVSRFQPMPLLAAALLGAATLAACRGGDGSAVAPVAATPAPVATAPTPVAATPAPAARKNVIFFLGDGMGIVPLTAGRIYAVGEDGSLAIDTLPESAFVRTYSNDAQVTDSAPSMAAYMTGVKMNNEVIAMSPDTSAVDAAGNAYVKGADSTCPASGNGTPVTTLLELYKGASLPTGVVTTTRITHATPADTYAHLCHRDGENAIAAQAVPGGTGFNPALGDGVDVMFGGGFRHFAPMATSGSKRTDARDLNAEMAAKGYTVLGKNSAAAFRALDASTGPKALALFTDSHMSYDVERDSTKEPSLAEMTAKAIDILAARQKKLAANQGFFLMVEGGRIDHALHETRPAKAMGEVKAFDAAVRTALDRMQAIDPGLKNTLIVVTADHDHTMVMNGYAARTGATTAGNAGVIGVMKDYATGATAKDADGKPFGTLAFGNGNNRPARTRDASGALTGSEADLTDDAVRANTYQAAAAFACDGSVSDDCETHGGADVFLGAQGAGADGFHGVMTNTDVFDVIKKAVGF